MAHVLPNDGYGHVWGYDIEAGTGACGFKYWYAERSDGWIYPKGWSNRVIVQIGPLVAPRGYGSAKDCSLDHCFTPGALISSRSVWFSCLTTSLLRCNTSLGLLDFRSHWFLLKG